MNPLNLVIDDPEIRQQRIETDVLFPMNINDNAVGGQPFCRFTLKNRGFLSPDSRLILPATVPDDDYQYSDNLKKSSWAISVTPPLRKYEPTSDVITYPKHIIWNTNVVRRSRIQVNSNASAYNSINKSFGLTSLENFATSVYNTYVNPNSDIAEMQDSVNFNERSLNYNKVKSWGFHNTNSESEWVKFPSPDKP